MTPRTETYPANVQLLSSHDALPQLRCDLASAKKIFGWLYLVDETFFTDLFSDPLRSHDFFVVADHRQKKTLEALVALFPNFYPRTWSWNRTQHDKTLIIPNLNVVWLSTHNLTRGSWTLSTNRAARIESPEATKRLTEVFMADYQRARAVLPKRQQARA